MPEKKSAPVKKESLYETAKEKIRDVYTDATEKIKETKEKTRETIEEHPFASVIIAAAVGAITGILISELIRATRRKD